MKKRKANNLLLVIFLFFMFGILLIGLMGFVLGEENSSTQSNQTCTDSDGGLNYYIYGAASDTNSNFFHDGCLSDGSTLEEATCIDDKAVETSYKCPNGCKDGTCIPDNSSLKCIDSDGKNYYIKGSVKDSTGERSDYCKKGDEGDYVTEYFCSGSAIGYEPFLCPNGCQDGACLKESSTACTDSDGGINYYLKGIVSGSVPVNWASSEDFCTNDITLRETYCDAKDGNNDGYLATAQIYDCSNGCKDGACIKGEEISEEVECVFGHATKAEECYASDKRFNCGGIGSCVVEVKGYKGEKITWKSTCGGYAYTTMDGEKENAEFNCETGETNISIIKNNGFRYAYFSCYNGKEWKSEGKNCLSAELWKKKAMNFCNSECKKEKCGVNSFSIGEECYLEDENTICKKGDDIQECCSSWAKKNNQIIPACVGGWNIENDKCYYSCKNETEIPTEALVCKDSCPLDGKCYPFGYRKSGKYCTDNGGFEPQLKSDETCDNNFECTSNVCVSGKCISEGFLKKIMKWFSRMFGGE